MYDDVRDGTDSYIDDVIVNEDIVSADRVISVLSEFCLAAKPSESLDGARVLGLRVHGEGGKLMWRRDNALPTVSHRMTRRQVFSMCGHLIGHFPLAGWMRPACGYIKRETNGLAWDDDVDMSVIDMLKDVQERSSDNSPVHGEWLVPQVHCGVVRSCTRCASIDPAPIRWPRGALDVHQDWLRLAADVTH